MPYSNHVNRREFLGNLGAGALLGAAALRGRALGASVPGSWTAPPVMNNPNILVIMVDQLRSPMWLGGASESLNQVLPNIMGRIQNCSYNFGQYFVAATVCTPSRSALLTGLYAPQTAMYSTGNAGVSGPPFLDSAFPTWGEALAQLNPAYAGNVWWFGKWHLSDYFDAAPLQDYGFNTRTYPGGPAPYNTSPNGACNEGTDGGSVDGQLWANDSMIASDFISWLQGQPSQNGSVASPWCATVSLVNPHDITYAPAWLQNSPFPPRNVPSLPLYFSPPVGPPPSLFSSSPTPWNYEDLSHVLDKPSLQYAYQNTCNNKYGPVNNWPLFLNQYYWLQNFVDVQVGRVLDALNASPYLNNTVIIFTSDHGEYAGSHGLHTKGFAAYDESMQVPFCVQFPGQSTQIPMNQMSSSVDFFGLICDLATGGSGQWALAYPDLANRQSIWSFLYDNSSETRLAPEPVGIPYVLHTCDEGAFAFSKAHITCVRTKLDTNAGANGAKLAFYTNWQQCATYPDGTQPDWEFYDYNPSTLSNTSEMGNNYSDTNNSTTLATLAQYQKMLGSWGAPGNGLIASELNAPLIGKDADGNPLSQAQAIAQQAYLSFVNSGSGCSG